MSKLEDALKELERVRKRGVITDAEYEARRAAIIYDPTNLRPETRVSKGGAGRGLLKWCVLGCFAIFAAVGLLVVGLMVIIAVAVGSAGSSLADLKDVHVAFADGATGTVTTAGNVKNSVTIRKIADPAISTNQFEQPAAGKHYISVAVTIANVGTHETTGGLFTLRTADGTEYKDTFVSGVGASDLNSFQSLTAGGKTDAVLAFELADGQKVQWLKFDPNPFAKGDLYFDGK